MIRLVRYRLNSCMKIKFSLLFYISLLLIRISEKYVIKGQVAVSIRGAR